jgi:hypothetical protein
MPFKKIYQKRAQPPRPPRGKLRSLRHHIERLTANGEVPTDEVLGRLLGLRADLVARLRRELELLP